jgi:NitT/TauT family transport system substrate-binding protein
MKPPLGTLRAAFESSGSPSWVMRVIKARGFDRRRGFRLDLGLCGDCGSQRAQATEAAVAAGAADLIDTDWISIARSRRSGPGLVAVFPYGRIMGGVVTAAGVGITSLADLPGRRIGVVRVLDKNWMVVRAASLQRYGFDPQMESSIDEALSKTALVEWLETGRVEAAVLPWHIVPRVTAGGRFRHLCDVLDLLPDAGATSVPTTFFAVRADFAASRRDLITAFIAAYIEAVGLMRADEDVWREAAASPDDGAELLADLRAAWGRRICSEWAREDGRSLQLLFERLRDVAGEEALGVADMPKGLFAPAFMH